MTKLVSMKPPTREVLQKTVAPNSMEIERPELSRSTWHRPFIFELPNWPDSTILLTMVYEQIRSGIFLSRPNRFIAEVELDGRVEVCHVKNTGRCRELLVPGYRVFLAHSENQNRKTAYDLIAVDRAGKLINMDSQAPNAVAKEWLRRRFGARAKIRPEIRYGHSRLDFCVEIQGRSTYVEVKGCTLERDNVALFPDAPTERGTRHLHELARCACEEEHGAMVLFVIQMEGVLRFCPNDAMDPAFGEALRSAAACGVEVLAVDCRVTPDSLIARDSVPVDLNTNG